MLQGLDDVKILRFSTMVNAFGGFLNTTHYERWVPWLCMLLATAEKVGCINAVQVLVASRTWRVVEVSYTHRVVRPQMDFLQYAYTSNSIGALPYVQALQHATLTSRSCCKADMCCLSHRFYRRTARYTDIWCCVDTAPHFIRYNMWWDTAQVVPANLSNTGHTELPTQA